MTTAVLERYVIPRRGMISGQADAQSRIYRLIPCKNSPAVWLASIQPNVADNLYFHDPRQNGRSDGFGGATLKFQLENGTIYEAQGPWHGNSESMFYDTGVDVRSTHLTFVVIALRRDHVKGEWDTVLGDVLYKDENPQLGSFYRYVDIIRERFADQLPVFYYSESCSGSSCGPFDQKDLGRHTNPKERF